MLGRFRSFVMSVHGSALMTQLVSLAGCENELFKSSSLYMCTGQMHCASSFKLSSEIVKAS